MAPNGRAKNSLRDQAAAARAESSEEQPHSGEIVKRTEIEALFRRPDVEQRFRSALAGFMDLDAFVGIMVTLVNNDRNLQQADPRTLLVASMHIAMSQLSPSPFFGEAWVVSFRNGAKSKRAGRNVHDAQFILGYKGVERLALDSGLIKNIGAGLVYADDDLEYQAGTNAFIHHRSAAVERSGGRLVPIERDPKEEPVASYAFAETVHGGTVFEILPYESALRTREGSQSYQAYLRALRAGNQPSRDSSPWITHPREMVRKTMVHRLRHQLPFSSTMKSLRLAHAFQADGTVGSNMPETPGGLWVPEYADGDGSVIDVDSWEEAAAEVPMQEMSDGDLLTEIRRRGALVPDSGAAADAFDGVLATHGIDGQTWHDAMANAPRPSLLAVLAVLRQVTTIEETGS